MNKRDSKGRFISENKVWKTPKGYFMCWYKGKNKLLHEKIWEDYHGCKKPKGFVIHHKDKNKKNNKIHNLQLVTEKIHKRIHAGWIMKDNSFVAKPCNKCKRSLTLDKFYERKGYSPSAKCKKCHYELQKEYLSRPKIKIRNKEYKKQWYLNNKK